MLNKPMARWLLFCVGVLVLLSGCEFFEKQRQPIGYSRKGNVTIPNREEKVGPFDVIDPWITS